MTFMSPDDFNDFINFMVDAVGDDPCQAERFAFAIKRACPQVADVWKNLAAEKRALEPFPALDTITAAQCTLFDNWKSNGGRKPKTINGKREKGARAERFKVAIEIWTIDPERAVVGAKSVKLTRNNAAWVSTAHLMDGPRLKKKIDELRSPKKCKRPFAQLDQFDEEGAAWQVYGDFLRDLADDMGGLRIGPAFSNGDGTRFHLETFVAVNELELENQSNPLIALQSPAGDYRFEEWSSSYPNGSPLRGNAVLTSRMSTLPQKRLWVTTKKKP